MKNIVVIGAGAAGLMSAVTAAYNGNKVTILEHKDVIGKKLKITGNGKCNFTNTYFEKDSYRSDNIEFVEKALKKFDAFETIKFFEKLGMFFIEKNGYVYPKSETASSVVSFFENLCKKLDVDIIYKAEVKKIIGSIDDFSVQYITDGKRLEIEADRVIIAAGSKAAAGTGSDGSGYYFAKNLCHNVIDVVPGLVGLKVEEKFIKNLSGVRAKGKIKLFVRECTYEDYGEIQFTSYGISGIPTFQVSRYATKELLSADKVYGCIELLSEFETMELAGKLIDNMWGDNAEEVLKNAFLTILNEKVSEAAIAEFERKYYKTSGGKKISLKEVTAKNNRKEIENIIEKFVEFVKNIPFTVTDHNGFENAQICAGGVDTREVEDTMESKLVKGVYFAGEVLDADGKCGGHNLQWAWSSGYIAGSEVGK